MFSDFFSVSLTDLPGLAGAGWLVYSWWRDRSQAVIVTLAIAEEDGVSEAGDPVRRHRISFESSGVSLSPEDFLGRVEIRPPMYEDVDVSIRFEVVGEYPLPLLQADISRKLCLDSGVLALQPFALEPGERFEIVMTAPRGQKLLREARVDVRTRNGVRIRRA